MSSRYSIQVQAPAAGMLGGSLLEILEELLPVRFDFSQSEGVAHAAELIVGESRDMPRGPAVGSLQISPVTLAAPDDKLQVTVRFSETTGVPFPFRGRTLRTTLTTPPQPLELKAGETPLATIDGRVVWTCSETGGVSHFRSSLRLPAVSPQEGFQDVFNGKRFLEMLPLLHWLRGVCSKTAYQNPSLRASFIFDDPNLHWPSYGFVDFQEIAKRSAKENYHVCFATIPLDTWFTHRGVAEVFKKSAGRLSLAVHGNNHLKQELARKYSEPERLFLLQQALRRIGRLERRSGLNVCRIMVPPHGACSEEMLTDLPKCGFEAACISHGSLRAHNRNTPWVKTLGYFPSELIHGCPVLPRWAFTGEDVEGTILVAAFLNQPIILRGHHDDLRDGVGLLDKLAAMVNRLGPVAWSNLTDLSRDNYQRRVEDGVCHVRPLSRRFDLRSSTGITQLVIESPDRTLPETWEIAGLNGSIVKVGAGEGVRLAKPVSKPLQISVPATHNGAAQINGQRVAAKPLIRRLLTEARDRFVH